MQNSEKINIVYVKSLFCPNDNYFNMSYNSLSNNLNYFLTFKLKIDVILIGWINKTEYSYELKEKIEILIELLRTNININLIIWDKNYGKIKLFHQFNKFFETYDYIFYSDHDILFDITKTKLNNLFPKIENIFNKYNFSILTFNQLEDCRHQSCLIDDDNIEIYDGLLIVTSEINTDIAGGCFIIKKTFLAEPKYYHVYGFDEKYLNSCINGKNGVLLEYHVVHPYNKDDIINKENKSYKKWKINKIVSNLEIYDKISFENYIAQIKESDEFWSKII
jgi:hypothetical protein